MRVHVGVKLPNWGPLAHPTALRRVAEAAEARGFGSVWVSDHVVMPADPLADYPYSSSARPPFSASTPFLDPFTSLSFVAACTERVQLGTGVLVLPLRQPIVVAKQAASLDVLASGRTLLGVGAGWLEDEFALLGQVWRDRGRNTDQAIEILRGCWRPDTAELPDGTRVGIAPAPTQGEALPILIGGHSPAAMRRAARVGDGWYASNVTVEQFAELVRGLRGIEAAQDPPRERLVIGVRPGVVDPADAAGCAVGLEAGGADFVVLDAPFAALDVTGAVDWVHRTADALSIDASASIPVVSRRSWSAVPRPAPG